MRTHTSNYKSEIAKMGRQFNAVISYCTTDAFFFLTTEDGKYLLTEDDKNLVTEKGIISYDSEHIYSIEPSVQTELFKTVMPMIEFETDAKIPINECLTFKYGLLVDGEYEYLDYGNYSIIEEPVYNADTKTYTHKAYKKMYESMVSYDNDPLDITFPITLKNLIIAICNKLEWQYNLPTTFPNQDTEITEDLYTGLDFTYRDILDDICPATMGNFIFDNDDVFTIKYPTETNDTIDGNYIKDFGVDLGETYGPVNSLTLSRVEDSDVIYRKDDTSIAENGLTELKINDNILLSSSFREDFIQEMFDSVNGLEYNICDFTSTGVCYYEPLDRFTVNHEDKDYSIILLNDIQNIGQGLSENIYLDDPELNQSDYSVASTTDKSVKNAVIIANKNKAEIELKVNSDEVVSSINLSPETITISSNKIDVDGVLEVLGDSGSTVINADNITTGTISTNRLDSDVITTTNFSAQSIDADNITAGSIDASDITITNINASNITTGNLQSSNYVSNTTGTKISLTDGTIDTKGFKVSSVGAITATSGTIGGWTINSSSLSGSGTISGGTISGSSISGGKINITKGAYYFNMGVYTSNPRCSGLNVGYYGVKAYSDVAATGFAITDSDTGKTQTINIRDYNSNVWVLTFTGGILTNYDYLE